MSSESGRELAEERQLYLMATLLSRGWSSSSLEEDEVEGRLNSLRQCLVCLRNNVTESGCRACCDQPVCQACLERYVRSKLETGLVCIGCPMSGCNSLVQVEELIMLDRELVQLYHRRLVDANSDPHCKTCPNCCLVTEVEPSVLSDHKRCEYGLVIDCTVCHFQWCFRCHGPKHDGVKCRKSAAADVLLQKWAQRKRLDPRAQQCPTCKVSAAFLPQPVLCSVGISLKELGGQVSKYLKFCPWDRNLKPILTQK